MIESRRDGDSHAPPPPPPRPPRAKPNLLPPSIHTPNESGHLGCRQRVEENLVNIGSFDILRNHGTLTYSLPAWDGSPALASARSPSALPRQGSGTETLWSALSTQSSSRLSKSPESSGGKLRLPLSRSIANSWSPAGFTNLTDLRASESGRKLFDGALEFADELKEQVSQCCNLSRWQVCQALELWKWGGFIKPCHPDPLPNTRPSCVRARPTSSDPTWKSWRSETSCGRALRRLKMTPSRLATRLAKVRIRSLNPNLKP